MANIDPMARTTYLIGAGDIKPRFFLRNLQHHTLNSSTTSPINRPSALTSQNGLIKFKTPHRPNPPLTRALPRQRNPTIHRAHKTQAPLPARNIPLRLRQPRPKTAPPAPQERVLPETPAPAASERARKAVVRAVRPAEGRMPVLDFQGAARAVDGVYAGDS